MKPDYISQDVRIKLYNVDCMEYLKEQPDNAFDLSIVDPPYGINIADWDNQTPSDKYFVELIRCSNNQIVWGGNYFKLPHSEAWLCWDKTFKFKRGIDLSEFELAWTSFKHKARFCRFTYCGNFYGWDSPRADYSKQPLIHPTQKPIDVYDWIYDNYSEKGQRILDTHLGSGSNAISAHYAGMEFVGCELDEDYFKASVERFERETAQKDMFSEQG